MTVFLNILFIIISLLFFAGRLYEIVFLSDGFTGFIENAIVSKPSMLFALFIIAVCCGIIIFGGKSEKISVKKIPVGILGFASGVFFIVGAVFTTMNIFSKGGFLLYPAALFIGGIGLIILGLIDIKGKSREKLPFICVMLLPIFNCLNNLVYDIETIYNTAYLLKCISGISLLAFAIFLFKAVYSKSKNTFMLLYIFALLNFTYTGTVNLAYIVGSFVQYSLSIGELLVSIGFALIGIYSLFVAFYILPTSFDNTPSDISEKAESTHKAENRLKTEWSDVNNNCDEFDDLKPVKGDTGLYDTEQVESISRQTIQQLFAQKEQDEEITQLARKVQNISETEKKPATVKTAYKATNSRKATRDYKGKKIVYKAPK